MPFGSIFGFDLARFQGKPPLDDLIAKGARFFATKANHGAGAADPSFDWNWRELGARKAKARRSPYMWLMATRSPEEQIDRLVAILEAAGYDDDDGAPGIDFEDNAFTPAIAKNFIERAVVRCKEKIGRVPDVYTGKYFWEEHVGHEVDSEIVAGCPLWFAQYPAAWKGHSADYIAAIAALPPHAGVPYPWAKRALEPDVWQFDGDDGLRMTNGVDVDVDLLREGLTPEGRAAASRLWSNERTPYTPEGPVHTLAEDARADAEESGTA